MEVKLEKQYPLDVDSAQAWALLSDLEATAGCMPGAAITEKVSESSYKGGVKVKVGPATAQFAGLVDVLEVNTAERKVVMRGKGADKGGSSASMDLTAVITDDPNNPQACVLNGAAKVIVNGKFAQFGGRMMVQVSEMILGQFVGNFQAAAQGLSPVSGSATATAVTSGQAPTAAPAQTTAPVVGKELDGLAIVWALIKGWFSGLFGKKA
jgi:carbon monoxide dehydrogenase subunit G